MRRDGKLSIFQFYVTLEIYVVNFTLEDNLFKKVKISVSERVPLTYRQSCSILLFINSVRKVI